MSDEQAPPVVAVVVASDPGPWFEECLAAIGEQDYPHLSVLVVDPASAEDPTPRVAGVLPQAFMRRLAANDGFAASANDALVAVEGAPYLLICHDDVAPAPDAVRRMVEEAIRSNAGVVAPKYVAWTDPDRLLQVGLGVDRFGTVVPRVEQDELDQSQHDEVRDVFAAPGGCVLIRADLFATLGGFDPQMTMLGEDVDFCWRAQVAGARVVVAPSATVRHLQATAGGVRPLPGGTARPRLLWRRHELRSVLKNYGRIRRTTVLAQLAVLTIIEIVYCLLRGQGERAADVMAAWRWNLRRERHVKVERRRLRQIRHVPDRAVARMQTSSAQRLRRFLRRALAGPEHERGPLREGTRQQNVVIVGITIVVLLVGVRNLLASPLPLIGSLAPLPRSTTLLGDWLGGWSALGLHHTMPAPPAFAVLGALGALLIGAVGLAQKVVLFGAVVLGAIGVWRLVRPFGSRRAPVVAAVVYLALPLAWNDLARGDLNAMVAFGGIPFVLARLMRASGLEPWGGVRRRLLLEIIGLGCWLALVAAFAPSAVLVELAAALALVAGTALAGGLRSCWRIALVGVAGAAMAFVVWLPWSLAYLQHGAQWSVLTGAASDPRRAPGLAGLMRFEIGPIGKGLLGWAFLAAALLPILIGRRARLAWASRLWIALFAGFGLAWAGAEGWLGAGGGAYGVFLVLPAVAIATCVALGVAAFERDLPGFRFGWRQLASASAAACVIAGLIPVLLATGGGRYSLPTTGYDQLLGWMSPRTAPPVAFRVLWLGDPAALPLQGWQYAPGYTAALSIDGLPDATDLWPTPSPASMGGIVADVDLARRGEINSLGHMLSSYGIRYIVVPDAMAPDLAGVQSGAPAPPPPDLVGGLITQVDLRQLPAEGGAYVFANASWSPSTSPTGRLPAAGPSSIGSLPPALGAAFSVFCWALLASGALLLRRRRRRSAAAEPSAGEPTLRDDGSGKPGGDGAAPVDHRYDGRGSGNRLDKQAVYEGADA